MADAKISQLPVATTPLAGTELVPVVQGGVTDQTTVEAILTGTVPSGTANGVLYLNGSKVVTSGSALTFNGTELSTTGNIKTTGGTGGVGTISFVSNYLIAQGGTNGVLFRDDASNNLFSVTQANSLFYISGSEAMRLNSAGLGIGTSSPDAGLHVNKTVSGSGLSTPISIFSGGAFNAGTAYGIGFHFADVGSAACPVGLGYAIETSAGDTAGSLAFYTRSSTTLGTAPTERMRLDSSGNLGLGVGPGAWVSTRKALQIGQSGVLAASTNSQVLDLVSNAIVNSAGNTVYLVNGFASYYRQFDSVHTWAIAASGTAGAATSFTQAMILNSSGNLGLGVTPQAWSTRALEIIGGVGISSVAGLDFTLNAYYNAGWLYRSTGAATRYEQVSGQHRWYNAASGTAGNPISFTQAMTLNASGNLGIGTTNPTQKLSIDGGASGTVTNVQVGNAATAFQLGVDGSNSCQIRTAQSVPILFYTAASERVRIKSTGQLRFVPLAADPAGAEAGDVYYNSGTNKLRLYDGSTWVDLN